MRTALWRMALVALVVAALAGRAAAQDAFRLDTAVIHGQPADIASWPIGVQITRITMRPEADFGLSVDFTPRQAWPDFVPPTPLPDGPWRGPLQYTVWACISWNGQPHCSGFIQMWRDRPSTGAPILAEWNRNWAYDQRWGEMARYRPQVGDTVWFFLVAGNSRNGQVAETAVRSRSNVVAVRLPANDTGTFTFAASSPEVPTAPVPVTPAPVQTSTAAVTAPGLSGDQWAWLVTTLTQIAATQQQHRDAIADLTEWARAWRDANEEAHRRQADVLNNQLQALSASLAASAPKNNDWKDYVLMGLMGAIGVRQEAKK